jgi:glycosyltransferase involved in cell wall biosynthesis
MTVGIFIYKISQNYCGGVSSYVYGLLRGLAQLFNNTNYKIFCNSGNYNFFRENFNSTNFQIINIDDQIYSSKSFIKLRKKVTTFFIDYIAVLPFINLFFSIVFRFFYKPLFIYLEKSNCDVIYVPNVFPLYVSVPVVTSIHDIQHVHHPNFFSVGQRIHRYIYFRETVKNSSIIQASSKYVAEDFINYFKINKSKVAVIRDGVDEAFFNSIGPHRIQEIKNKFCLFSPFIFYPAQHWKHKNHITLIKAATILKERYGLRLDLVFTGEINRRYNYLYRFIKNSSIKNDIKLLGNVTREELICLYKLCEMVIMPSLHESNSLVILEALAAGTLVSASDIEPNIELNDGSFVLFKQLDANDLSKKIFSLFSDSQKNIYIEKGKFLASNFTWKKTAENYSKVFSGLI